MIKDRKIGCFMYQLEFTKLTLKVQKEEQNVYNAVLMEVILREYNEKHFIATKINKATRTGTKVKFEIIEDFEKARDKILEIGKELGVKLEVEEKVSGI